jgi:hypothetical protein
VLLLLVVVDVVIGGGDASLPLSRGGALAVWWTRLPHPKEDSVSLGRLARHPLGGASGRQITLDRPALTKFINKSE